MRKFLSALLALALLAVPVAAAEVESGGVYCFSAGDFSDETLTGICVTRVPDNGAVLLGDRIIRAGDILTAGQVEQMTFSPTATEVNREAVMTYLPIYPDRVEAARTMAIAVLGREDLSPVAEDSALETYKNLPVEGRLMASDPEEQALTYALTRQPRRGTVTIREDGSFTYEPKKNKVGVDSFTYTATDPAGHVSREATVIVTILKPSQAQQYTDTMGQSCRFAAEWMKNTGIFTAEQVSGANCFQPDKTVSRGEFLTMLVSALELDTTDVETTALEDSPAWLRPYLAAAMRCGLTAGLEEANSNEPITGEEAAVMIQNALDLPPAEDAMATLAENGFTLTAEEPLTRACAAEALYRMSQLAKDAPGMQVFDEVQ